MKTFDGYSKEKFSDTSVLLAGGGSKELSNFIGTLNWDSTNRKLQYKKIGDTNWRDLVTFGSNATNSTAYLPLAGGTMTGDLTVTGINFQDTDGSKPVLKIGSPNKDTTIWRVYSSDNTYGLNSSIFGYSLKYLGTGGGNDNKLVLIADNQTGARVTAVSMTQDGVTTFNSVPYVGNTPVSLFPYIALNGGLSASSSVQSWGTTTGTCIAHWSDGAGGNFSFRKNCPSSGKVSMIIDGYIYQNEGNYRVLDTSDKAGLFTDFSNAGSQTTSISIGGITKDLKIDADLLDGCHSYEYGIGYRTKSVNSGWIRIAQTANQVTNNIGLFSIIAPISSYHTEVIISAGITYGYEAGIELKQIACTYFNSKGLTKARIVHDGSWSGNHWAYLEVYISTGICALQVKKSLGAGWELIDPVAGSIPSGYKSKEITFYSNKFVGDLQGNATTSNTWYTARTLTIGNTGKSVDGSGNVSWSLAEIGASASAHTHSVKINGATKTIAASNGAAVDLGNYLPLSGGTMSGSIILKGSTSSDMTYASNVHPYIRFDNSDSSQNVSLIFTDYDSYRSPAGIKLIGNQGGEWFEAPNIYATNFYGTLSGNASSATKLTSSAGSAALPIYFSNGKPVACTPSSLFSNLSNSGNDLSITVAGQNRTLTVGYASNSNIATYLNVQYCRDDSIPYNKGLWNTIKNGTTNTISNRVRFYTIYGTTTALGAPINGNGELLEICSYNANHWQPQLWFGSRKDGRLYYRNKTFNDDSWGAWRTVAWTSDIPTSLKNPYALTISLNGTSQGAYDGSAAKNINITPSSIGAASSSHTHSYANIGFVTFTPANGELTPAQVLALTGGWSIKKGSWYFAGNGYIAAGSFGNIDLAGTSVLTFGDSNAYTQLYITAPAQSGHSGKTNEIFFYNNHGSDYSPGWTRVITNRNYTDYVNATNFPGLNKTGTVTSVTVTGANGLSGTGTITTSGIITLSNSGVRSTTINGNYLRVNTNGTNSDLTIPYATNADKIDGYHASMGQSKPWGTIPAIGFDGVIDLGRYMDWHYDNTTGSDYSTRLQASGNHSNVVNLPSASGTLALTSQIPSVTNYYWANIKISASSSTSTSPTFGSVVSTGLISAKSGVQIGSTSDIGWYFNNSRICAGSSTARGVNTGSLLVSNAWADYSKVPTNGIYSKGNIITSANINTLNLNLNGDGETDFGINFNEGSSTGYGFSLLYGVSDTFRLITRDNSTTSTILTIGRGSTTVNFKGVINAEGNITTKGKVAAVVGLETNGSVYTEKYITFGDYGARINSDIRSSWRTSIYGNTEEGSRLKTIRTDITIDNFSEIYGSGLAWATGDTQGYLSVSYNSGKAWIGGGNKDTLNWSTYLVTGNNIGSQSVRQANCLKYTGLGTSVFTVAQTSNDFCGRSGWATYLIGNHGNGSTYYHQIIAMPFDKMPQYQRLENGTQGSWYTFAMMGYANSGDLYAAHFYENSDIRYKHNIKNRIIEITNLASLPIFDYTWEDSIEINTGTSAQAVQEILPNLVSGTDKLTLDYGVLGTIAGITACKELVTQKSEIELLKDRIEQLEQQLKIINDY